MIAEHHGKTMIQVMAPARLHLGFIDLAFDLGRCFGSLGLAVDWPVTQIAMSRSPNLIVEGLERERAEAFVLAVAAALGLDPHVHVMIGETIPAHAGFGSGTQLALAVGTAFCALNRKAVEVFELAAMLKRGTRTSIGVQAFAAGGFLVDGGIGAQNRPAPILARLPFPEDWRILLVLDRSEEGLHGAAESRAFLKAPAFPPAAADHLCRLVLMKVMPALVEQDVDRFGSGIAEMQRILGDHFAPVQGGRFTSSNVASALAWLDAQGVGTGQSSWGPTGFAFVGSASEAERLRTALMARFPDPSLAFVICRGRNSGATVSGGVWEHPKGRWRHAKAPHPPHVLSNKAYEPIRREHGS